MTDKIKAHLDYLLKDAPKTRRIEEMREELLAGCLDKYEDLTASGMSPEDAYTAVISGIGDVDELVAALSKENVFNPSHAEKNHQKKVMMISLAVMMYIFAFAAAILMDVLFNLGDIGAVMLFVIAGGATVLIVYTNMTANKRYEKVEDTIVEEVKVAMSMGGTEKGNKLLQAASSSLWSLVVLAYLFIGFAFNWWHPGWIIFPFGAFLQTLLNAVFAEPSKRGKHYTSAIFVGAVCAFLLLGSLTSNGWKFGWLTIIFALAVNQISKLIRVWRDTK